jgi:uncharacterized protein (TIGR00255 family)
MRSMTGFGTAAVRMAAARVTVDVRAVNHRFLDVRVTLPREYAPWEGDVRALVRAHATRGRIELAATRFAEAEARRYRVETRHDAARTYITALRKLKREMKLAGDVDVHALTAVPDLIRVTEIPAQLEREQPGLVRAVTQALAALGRDRQREGANLAREMLGHVRELVTVLEGVDRQLPEAVRALSERTNERIRRLAAGVEVDPHRLAQEAAILAERADVTEELVRLRSHVPALRALLRAAEPVGKRIEFLLQEMHREINTLGAKVGNALVTGAVLDAKALVEKLREQVQNIE